MERKANASSEGKSSRSAGIVDDSSSKGTATSASSERIPTPIHYGANIDTAVGASLYATDVFHNNADNVSDCDPESAAWPADQDFILPDDASQVNTEQQGIEGGIVLTANLSLVEAAAWPRLLLRHQLMVAQRSEQNPSIIPVQELDRLALPPQPQDVSDNIPGLLFPGFPPAGIPIHPLQGLLPPTIGGTSVVPQSASMLESGNLHTHPTMMNSSQQILDNMSLSQIRMMQQQSMPQIPLNRLLPQSPATGIPQAAEVIPRATRVAPKPIVGRKHRRTCPQEPPPTKLDKPPHPLSAYNFFFRDEKPQVFAEWKIIDKSRRLGCLAQEIARRWKSLGETKRKKYNKMAADDHVRYQRELRKKKQLWQERMTRHVEERRARISPDEFNEYLNRHEEKKRRRSS